MYLFLNVNISVFVFVFYVTFRCVYYAMSDIILFMVVQNEMERSVNME